MIINWNTNMPATSQVVYGTESIDEEDLNMRSDTFGYQDQTIEMDRDLDDHYMAVTDLEPDTEYYFRPVSEAKGQEAIGVELSLTTPPEAERSPAKDIECSYLEDYLRRDFDNDPIEVYKLQVFLNEYENIDTPVSGVFDQATYESVVEFQERYADQVLHPWGHTEGTGYVYITTKKLINEIVCEDEITLGEGDLAEIESYRAFMSNLEREGLTPPFTQEEVDRLRDEFGDDVDSFIEEDEDTEEEGSEPYDLKEMEIGLEDDEDEDEEKDEEKGLMAGASSALTDFPSTLHEATENLIILILMILLIYLLTILLIPVSSEAPSTEDERRTSFKRIVLFSSLVLVAFLGVLALSVKGLATPLGAVLAISVLVLIMKLKDKKRPINQELDLGES